MRHNIGLLGNEIGSALMIVVWTTVILLTLGAGVAYTTSAQRLQSARDVSSLNALNIAEAVANERVETWNATGTSWDATSALTTATGTISNGVKNGTYTLAVTTDTRGAAYKLITATGTFNGASKTVKVVVKAFPQIFNYAVASSGKLELEAESGKPITIVGPIETNGNLTLTQQSGATLNLTQASGTYNGTLTKNPTSLVAPFTSGPDVTLPVINIAYYSVSSNFPGQTVYNINLASPPAWMVPYRSGTSFSIPATAINTNMPNGIVNFAVNPYNENYKVEIKNDAVPFITLNQTFTSQNFGELEFKGNIKLLPTNGQAIIAFNMKETEVEGGVVVGAIGNGALIYSYGTGLDSEGKPKGKIEIEGASLYGSLIQNMTGGDNAKAEIEGAFIQFDASFIDKLGAGAQSQFSDWGNFDLKKVHYGQ